MRKALRDKIIAYNQALALRKEKAEDMELVASALLLLPPGQLKKLLTPDILTILEKYAP